MASAAELQYAQEQGIERGIEQGIEQGIERGIEQGVLRGQQRVLHRLLARHIGELPPSVAARVDTLTSDQLEELSEAMFDLNSYADVEAWLSRQ
ncbi:MAG: DUF4351 domain-containing protein [Capsulimonadaceae bacterium]